MKYTVEETVRRDYEFISEIIKEENYEKKQKPHIISSCSYGFNSVYDCRMRRKIAEKARTPSRGRRD